MPSFVINGNVSLSVHLPDAEAGRFHFSMALILNGKARDIAHTAMATLLPALSPYLRLHGCDHTGAPPVPTAADALLELAKRAVGTSDERCSVARLLRVDNNHIEMLALDIEAAVALGGEEAQIDCMRRVIDGLRPRWRREANEAIAQLTILLIR